MSVVDIVIPVKNRPLTDCVQSLLTLSHSVGKILICDGGSTQSETLNALASFQAIKSIQVINYPIDSFNKATLINQGIRQARAEILLVSDADIIWNQPALDALIQTVQSQPQNICHIENVIESEHNNQAMMRQRYSYIIKQPSVQEKVVIVQSVKNSTKNRPGCGLVCAHRQTFWQLGGYKEIFQGWGWEDWDLLIRAEVLDIPILKAGEVIHLSHSDEYRNQFFGHLIPQETRDINIIKSLKSLQDQQFFGGLGNHINKNNCLPKVRVQIPSLINQ